MIFGLRPIEAYPSKGIKGLELEFLGRTPWGRVHNPGIVSVPLGHLSPQSLRHSNIHPSSSSARGGIVSTGKQSLSSCLLCTLVSIHKKSAFDGLDKAVVAVMQRR